MSFVSSLGDVRRRNAHRVLASLFRAGAGSRAEIARRLGLTRSTAGSLVQHLIDEGLVRERAVAGAAEAVAATRRGRPGTSVELVPDGACFLGASIGIERLVVVAIGLDARVTYRRSVPHDGRVEGPEATVDRLLALLDEAIDTLAPGARPRGTSVAVPGFLVDDDLCNAAILGWHDVSLGELLGGARDGALPCLFENDANAFAVAECYARHAAGDEADDLVAVLLETGVGAGIVQDGRLFHGRRHAAGEFGHLPVGPWSASPGAHGSRGDARRVASLEALIGKAALIERWRELGGHGADVEALLGAYAEGEREARDAVCEWSDWLGRGLATLACLLEPRHVVVGGALAGLCRARLDALRRDVGLWLGPGYPAPLVTVSELGEEGPAIGAACLLHRALLEGTLPG